MMVVLLLAMAVQVVAVALILVLPHQVKVMSVLLVVVLHQRMRLAVVVARGRLALHSLVKLLVAVA